MATASTGIRNCVMEPNHLKSRLAALIGMYVLLDNFRVSRMSQSFGSIYTPTDYAKILAAWAIRDSSDRVLDLGIGTGAFIFAALDRLLELGAKQNDAQQRLYGAEIDSFAFNELMELASLRKVKLPHLQNTDFFEMEVPMVDAIIGNPPYVRRTYLENVDRIRKILYDKDPHLASTTLSRLSDLYVYFVLYSLNFLKPGGRLAVITADPWLNVAYGDAFKAYLLQHVFIEKLITFDRRVFDDAQVKPVLILATKLSARVSTPRTDFVRVKNGLAGKELQSYLAGKKTHPDISSAQVSWNSLDATHPWGVYFKAPKIYDALVTHDLMVPITTLAKTRIGLQTLAKDFFVLTSNRITELCIEEEFLQPLAQSLAFFPVSVIEHHLPPEHYLFYCSQSKQELAGTYALRYILQAESQLVKVRGKDATVIGYQNKERIQRAGRKYWYDLKTALERRGRARILIPRLVYQTFKVVWNKAEYVPGELFIEFLPRTTKHEEIYLAILNSTLMELILRGKAQVYGGGTYNISPGMIKSAPIINVERLSDEHKKALVEAYRRFSADTQCDRSLIDTVVADILQLDHSEQTELKEVVGDMHLIATSSKKSGPG